MPQGILAYQSGIEPTTYAREGEVLTTGLRQVPTIILRICSEILFI